MNARAAFPGFLRRFQIQIVCAVFERESGVLPGHVFETKRAVDEMALQRAERLAHAGKIRISAPRRVEGMAPAERDERRDGIALRAAPAVHGTAVDRKTAVDRAAQVVPDAAEADADHV